MEPKKESKKAVCDVKVKLIKLEGGTAAPPPRGREKSRVRIGASAIRPLEYFPYGLASPARADFIGVPRGALVVCGSQVRRVAIVVKRSQVS